MTRRSASHAKAISPPVQRTPQMLRVLIVDDEPLARARLDRLLDNDPAVEIVGHAESGADAARAIASAAPDVILLDVEMADGGGFDLIEQVGRDHMPAVVFVTAYANYAVRAFDAYAVDYVLKPVASERLKLALARVRERLGCDEGGWLDRLAAQDGDRIRILPLDEVHLIEAAGNYVDVHASAGRFSMRMPLTHLARRLDPKCFVRVHRSALVRLASVRAVESLGHGRYLLDVCGGHVLASGRTYRVRLRAALGLP
jgi:two-component system, LytTR family, response regulator